MSEFCFVESVARRLTKPEDIDKFIEKWHRSKSHRPLHEYLGLTLNAYTDWIGKPKAIREIVRTAVLSRIKDRNSSEAKHKFRYMQVKSDCTMCKDTGVIMEKARKKYPVPKPCPNCEKGEEVKKEIERSLDR